MCVCVLDLVKEELEGNVLFNDAHNTFIYWYIAPII